MCEKRGRAVGFGASVVFFRALQALLARFPDMRTEWMPASELVWLSGTIATPVPAGCRVAAGPASQLATFLLFDDRVALGVQEHKQQ